MTDIAQLFIDNSRQMLMTDYLPKIERCLDPLTDEDVWWRPNENSNSIGNLLLHLCGNVTEWIIGGVGQREYERNRQHEFDERAPLPAKELLARVKAVLQESDEVIGALGTDSLTDKRQIQGYEVSVLEAIYHVVEHFGMHTGQIILLSRMRTG